MSKVRFTTEKLPVGGEHIPVLVGREGDAPKAVFMSYEAFLELAAALYTAVDALRSIGIDPDTFGSPEPEMSIRQRPASETEPS